jgi:glycerol kinase
LENAQQSEEMAKSLTDNGGVYIVPAFTGLGAPYWDGKARAIICGLSAGAKKEHIARAALESIAYQVKDIVDCAVLDTGMKPQQLRADGGPTKNGFLMQFLADMLDADISTSKIEELSAKGCALMAGLAVGIWNSQEELSSLRGEGGLYTPNMDSKSRSVNFDGWKTAVKRARMEA